MFNGCTIFNQPITMNTSSLNNTTSMFLNCQAFDSAVTFTDTSNVTTFINMFSGCLVFNQAINLNTSSATSFQDMFYNCKVV